MIRPIAVALVEHEGHLLLMRIEHPERGVVYRPLGGSIEFGEYGAETVVREFQEELGASLAEPVYLGTVENLFRYQGEDKHEIVLVFRAELVDPSPFFRVGERIPLADDPCEAVWLPLAAILNGEAQFVPEAAIPLVRA